MHPSMGPSMGGQGAAVPPRPMGRHYEEDLELLTPWPWLGPACPPGPGQASLPGPGAWNTRGPTELHLLWHWPVLGPLGLQGSGRSQGLGQGHGLPLPGTSWATPPAPWPFPKWSRLPSTGCTAEGLRTILPLNYTLLGEKASKLILFYFILFFYI